MRSFKILLRFRCLSLVSWLCTYLLNSGYLASMIMSSGCIRPYVRELTQQRVTKVHQTPL